MRFHQRLHLPDGRRVFPLCDEGHFTIWESWSRTEDQDASPRDQWAGACNVVIGLRGYWFEGNRQRN